MGQRNYLSDALQWRSVLIIKVGDGNPEVEALSDLLDELSPVPLLVVLLHALGVNLWQLYDLAFDVVHDRRYELLHDHEDDTGSALVLHLSDLLFSCFQRFISLVDLVK